MNDFRKYINTFTNLSETGWELMMQCAAPLKLTRKELLLKEGQVCDAVFFIVSGLCRSSYHLDGKEINTGFYFEQDFVTNIKSLRQNTPSEYFIQACEPTELIRLDKQKLLEAYQRSPEVETFGRKVLELLVSRQEEHANTFKLLSPKQRFDNLMASRPDFMQRVSLTQTASYLGISRETLSRFRSRC